jgi:hypothetical protein
MSRASLVVALVLVLAVEGVAGELAEIRGLEAEAISLAIKRFKSGRAYKDEQGGPVYGDLRHYSVFLERHPREFEVIFVPDADKYGTIGGGTAYGWEIHYHFSLKPLKFLKEDYAK